MYVDDFKMAGPTVHVKQGWDLFRQKIKTEEPTPSGKYLGCDHKLMNKLITVPSDSAKKEAGGDPKAEHIVKPPPLPVSFRANVIEYDMSSFLSQCVDRYCELAHVSRDKLKRVDTPFTVASTSELPGEESHM